MRLTTLVTAVALVLTFNGCARYIPPEALAPPAAQFTSAIATVAKDTRKERLADYRRDVRHDIFLGSMITFLGTSNATDEALARILKANTPAQFLCEPRYGHTRVSMRLGNVEAVGLAVGERLEKPGDDLGKLFKALGANYAIKLDAKDPPASYAEWVKADDGKTCVDAVVKGDPFAYRSDLGREFAFAGLPAALTALEAVWAILKPVAVGTLQNIDLERRNAAVRDFFANADNVKRLKEYLQATEAFLVREFDLAQRRTAGEAGADAAILFSPTAPHWVRIKAIAASAPCRAALPRLVQNKLDPEALACLREAKSAASKPLNAAQETAEKFDKAIEQNLPQERLSAQVDTLALIATGKQPAEAQLKALWAASMRYVTLFKSIEDLTSDENQKKISDALAQFIKALQ